jgi:hypothetical protein
MDEEFIDTDVLRRMKEKADRARIRAEAKGQERERIARLVEQVRPLDPALPKLIRELPDMEST